MRVLTVRQPWAWAIIHGGKDVENRTRNIAGSYRGPVAIQAGLAYVKGTPAGVALKAAHGSETTTELKFGAVIGVVDLSDVHHDHDSMKCVDWEHGITDDGTYLSCSEWSMADHHHLCLSNPRPIDPIPAKGRLGLLRPDPELQAQIEAALS